MSDLSDDDDLPEEPQHELDVDDHPARVWNLLLLINPGDEETALQQFDAWREAIDEAAGDEDAEVDEWLWTLKDVIDWRSGFCVDSKDVDAFVSAIDELAARWNLRIDWGGDFDDEEFSDSVDVPELMGVAYDRLREYGYSLWNWNTGGDSYAGWIALSRDDEGMLALGSLLEIELRPGSDPF